VVQIVDDLSDDFDHKHIHNLTIKYLYVQKISSNFVLNFFEFSNRRDTRYISRDLLICADCADCADLRALKKYEPPQDCRLWRPPPPGSTVGVIAGWRSSWIGRTRETDFDFVALIAALCFFLGEKTSGVATS